MERLFIVGSVYFILHFILHTSLQLCVIVRNNQIWLPHELELWYY